jgi:hypothetical protein
MGQSPPSGSADGFLKTFGCLLYVGIYEVVQLSFFDSKGLENVKSVGNYGSPTVMGVFRTFHHPLFCDFARGHYLRQGEGVEQG